MPDPVSGIMAAVSIGGSVIKGNAAKSAANQQAASDAAAIAEQRRQFDQVQQLLAPYVQAGTPALKNMMAIVGLDGMPAQQEAIAAQEASPFFQDLARQGESAILQNASATGGLRGGNTQGALAQFRPQLLNQFIEQQYGRLGGIAGMGQNSAAGVGSAGMGMANSISSLLQNTGQARAGATLAQGNAWGNTLGNVGGMIAGGLGNNAGFASLLPSVNQTIASNPSIF